MIEQSRGIQQGGTHSCLLFSLVVGLLLDDLNTEWMARGEDNLHGVFLWGYVDDILVAFTSWEQALGLSGELSARLAELCLNLSKTIFFSHASQLLVERSSFPESSAPFRCPWATHVKYLRKGLGTGTALRTATLVICLRPWSYNATPVWKSSLRCGSACIGLNPCSPSGSCKSTWQVSSCGLVLPTVNVVRILQVVVLTKFMHLCIPAELAFTEAMVAHRLRKRACYCLLNAHKAYSWVHAWSVRKFTYLGHLLRRPPCHLARRLLLAGYRDFVSGRAGPWRTHLQWLVNKLREVFEVEMHNLRSDSIHRVSETLVRLASDRHSWHTHSLHLYDRDWWPYHVFSATQWSNWRKPLTSQVPWWFCGYLSWTADGFKVVWLDRQEGFQAYTLEAVTVESVDHFVAYPSMQKPYFAVTLLVSSDFADVHMPHWSVFIKLVFNLALSSSCMKKFLNSGFAELSIVATSARSEGQPGCKKAMGRNGEALGQNMLGQTVPAISRAGNQPVASLRSSYQRDMPNCEARLADIFLKARVKDAVRLACTDLPTRSKVLKRGRGPNVLGLSKLM